MGAFSQCCLHTFFCSEVINFIELVEYLFSIPGVEKFLSGKLSQDPLEKFFGCVRQSRGTNENPNADEFVNIAQTLRVANSVCADVHIKRGNCRGQKTQENFFGERN